eukprot:gene14049-15510_t
MSACEVLLTGSTKDILKMTTEENEEVPDEDENGISSTDVSKETDEKKEAPKQRIMYTRAELLDLRSVPLSLKKPDFLSEEFFVSSGVWDPKAWHESEKSRSASPVVDGKCATFEHGKKIELLENAIELAPQRRSFWQGCHVQPSSEAESNDKGNSLLRRLRTGSNNDVKPVVVEGKDRLTGRAASQRKNIEKALLKDRDNKQLGDGRKTGKVLQDGKLNDKKLDVRESREKRRDGSNVKNNKFNGDQEHNEGRMKNRFNEKENKATIKEKYRNGYEDNNYHKRREPSNGSLPEWMTDGPVSQTDTIELKGFNAEIEEERKALIKDQRRLQERSRKSSKGSSRSSTPNDKKQRKNSRNEENKNPSENRSGRNSTDGKKRLTPSDKMFDENGLFDVMDYLPTHLFTEDLSNEPSTKSKFSTWFQEPSGNSSENSRPGSGQLGFRSASPSMQYFTPIQPAPATQSFERPIPVSPMMEIFPGNKPVVDKPKEVKGRVTLNEVEQLLPNPIGYKAKKTENVQKENDQNAFDKLVFTMKAAGQLPDKPAPVVSGLPEHLLPKPPKRTSPSFEKLKRALSRSPSPVNAGRISPFHFMNRSPSPLLPAVPERLLSPDLFQQTQNSKSVAPPTALFNSFVGAPVVQPSSAMNQHVESIEPRRYDNGRGRDVMSSSIHPPKLPTAFLPTSVIKKIHSSKQDQKERSDTVNSADSYSNFNMANTPVSQPSAGFLNQRNVDGKPSVDSAMTPLLSSRSFENRLNEKSDSLFCGPKTGAATSHGTHETEGNKLYHSAPVTPLDSQMSQTYQRSSESASAFSKPVDKFGMVRSANDRDKDDLASTLTQQRPFLSSDPFTSSNIHQSAHNNTRDNIDTRSKNHPPSTQLNGPLSQNLLQIDNRKIRGQLSNNPQRTLPTQPMHRQQQQQQSQYPYMFNQQSSARGRSSQSNAASRFPVPMNQSNALNANLNNRPNIPAVTAAMAAQLVQQQLLQQAARAHALQAAQAIQQQQQQNLLRTQMQAVMAQAYAREQAAIAAKMYNPRAIANNLQAVAQQMGLRPPHPSAQNKGLPTPMVNQNKEKLEAAKPAESNENRDKTKESPLSKWFNVEAIKKTPPAPQFDAADKSKVFTLEDLEKSQK